jgi:methionyl-tRNA synthetase
MTTRYITTPIYYVNDRPHIGHCYTTLFADALTRAERLRQGSSVQSATAVPGVFFLTGTDEHADKVVTSAAAHNMTAIQWADRNAAEFAKAFAFMECRYDDFIRTTQDRHTTRVTEYVTALIKSGAIYKGSYEGWYDENQEEYLTETVAKEQDYKSAVTGKPLVRRTEPCYFFKLSAFAQRIEAHFKAHPEFVQPEARRNEVLGRLRDGLNDVPISRPVTDDPATQFGIRVPGDEQHRIYVWIDALFNYLSVVDTDERRALWPASVHIIAKDILWFHAVIWPAMLMALQDTAKINATRFGFVGLPGTVYSHAYWVREGRKMSKSLGNFVTIEVLQAYAAKYSLDAVRWYMLTQGPQHAQDADFSHSKFVEVFNADLANGIGNCASRVANMIEKYFPGTSGGGIPAHHGKYTWSNAATGGTETFDWPAITAAASGKVRTALTTFDLPAALSAGIDLVRKVDQFINVTAPFKLAKTVEANPAAKDELGVILYQCAEAVRIASVLLSPALVSRMPMLWDAWGCKPWPGLNLEDACVFGAGKASLKPGQPLRKPDNLFMRADPAEAPPA